MCRINKDVAVPRNSKESLETILERSAPCKVWRRVKCGQKTNFVFIYEHCPNEREEQLQILDLAFGVDGTL